VERKNFLSVAEKSYELVGRKISYASAEKFPSSYIEVNFPQNLE